MSRHPFCSAVLLLVLWMYCSCGVSSAEIDLTAGAEKRSSAKWEEVKGSEKKMSSLRAPSLVKVGDDLFLIAEAVCEGSTNCGTKSRTGIFSKYLKETGAPAEISVDTTLDMQVLKDETADAVVATEMRRPTTFVSEKSVYMLLGNYDKASSTKLTGEKGVGLLLVKGTVSGEGVNKKITWGDTYSLKLDDSGKNFNNLIVAGGSGVTTSDGAVFPVQAKGEDTKDASFVLRFTTSDKKWAISSETMKGACGSPSVAGWGAEKDLLLMASCDNGQYNVDKSTGGDGASWSADHVPITGVWGTSGDRKKNGVQSGFVTATIEDLQVMLVTLPVDAAGEGKGELHLWLTDNARVHDVGPVSQHGGAAGSSLLYDSTKKELLSVYEKKNGESYSLVVGSLAEQLKQVTKVVGTWKALDKALKTCSLSSEIGSSKRKGVCTCPVPTEGLVGFLSTLEDGKWKDEYLGVDATVTTKGATSTEKGVTFQGVGAGAVWPVGKLGQTVPYYFANNKFTLVATVAIHEVPKKGRDSTPVSLVGVKMDDEDGTVLFGLSYTLDGKWASTTTDADAPKSGVTRASEAWAQDTTYVVILEKSAEGWRILVDGEELYTRKTSDGRFKTLADANKVSHFYFGAADEKSASGLSTVANVALYNRALKKEETDKVTDSKITIPQRPADEVPKGKDDKPKDGEEKPKDGDEKKPKDGDEKPKDGDEKPKDGSQAHERKPKSGDSAVHVCVSPVLLLALVVALWA